MLKALAVAGLLVLAAKYWHGRHEEIRWGSTRTTRIGKINANRIVAEESTPRVADQAGVVHGVAVTEHITYFDRPPQI